MKHDPDHLTDKQQSYVQHVASGMESRAAAKAATYSDSFSKVAAHRLGKKPAVAKAIEEIREKGRTMAAYGLVEAMKEADEAATFARLHKVPMAVVKACELRAKLSGLLIDRIEIIPIDLRRALEAAERRVIDVTNITPLPSNGALPAPVRWAPRIPGDPVAENPEAGPADGE